MLTKDDVREVMIEVLTPFYQAIGALLAIATLAGAYYIVIEPFMKRRRK